MREDILTSQNNKNSNQGFWQDFWNNKAKEKTDFQATGRSVMQTPDFLFTVYEIVRILDLKQDDELLDIGCGTGIIALALSPWIKHIHCIDISSEMIARTDLNTQNTHNITTAIGSITNPQQNNTFNKILAYSVLQYLKDEEELNKAMLEVKRLLKPGGIALLAANPDPQCKKVHIETVQSKPDQKMKKVEMNILDHTSWFSQETLLKAAEKHGLEASILPIHKRIWQHFYMFDLKLIKH